MKMTFQPKKRQRAKVHGFRARMKTVPYTIFTIFSTHFLSNSYSMKRSHVLIGYTIMAALPVP